MGKIALLRHTCRKDITSNSKGTHAVKRTAGPYSDPKNSVVAVARRCANSTNRENSKIRFILAAGAAARSEGPDSGRVRVR